MFPSPDFLAAVQQNGYALRHVPEALRTEALCLAAVQQNGDAIDYVPEERLAARSSGPAGARKILKERPTHGIREQSDLGRRFFRLA